MLVREGPPTGGKRRYRIHNDRTTPHNEQQIDPEEFGMGKKLGIGDQLTPISLLPANGAAITLPQALSTEFGVVIFYRGHW